MGITLTIVGGLIIITVVSVYFDYLGKKTKSASPQLLKRIDDLERRLDSLEMVAAEKDEKIKHLEDEVSFVNRLLEKKD